MSHTHYLLREQIEGLSWEGDTYLIEKLRDGLCDQVRRLDLPVAVRVVSFRLMERFGAVRRVAWEAGHDVGQE